ncbi:hypothetical protein JD79_02562 [Geodermatophilus normandii]|uniref:DUF222 domain-containing protein n=1 Tax=Geodermatophilus normandii TaxID=1137989 RepID=A0A317QIA2_9ACTN|nr:hypothetical protein [Geodermatophilus normandii]PWW23388.1 hypothetical protein JD79_02562 [Geodermatophilus normandii]
MDLEEVAGQLYALPPEGFVAARTEAARRARAAGDRALAREIGALGKPSTAAWACNALVQEAPDEIAGLVELGDLLREAQQTLAGDELRQLGTQRSRLLSALTRQARAVAARRGHPLSDAVADQVEETLRAALADPDAGEALLAGRLTAPLSTRGLGFGSRPDLRVVPPPRPGRTAPAPRPGTPGGRRPPAARRRSGGAPRRSAGSASSPSRARRPARRSGPPRRRRRPPGSPPSAPDGPPTGRRSSPPAPRNWPPSSSACARRPRPRRRRPPGPPGARRRPTGRRSGRPTTATAPPPA